MASSSSFVEVEREGRYRKLQKVQAKGDGPNSNPCNNERDILSLEGDFADLPDGSFLIQRMEKDSDKGYECYEPHTIKHWVHTNDSNPMIPSEKLTPFERMLIMNTQTTKSMVDHAAIMFRVKFIRMLHRLGAYLFFIGYEGGAGVESVVVNGDVLQVQDIPGDYPKQMVVKWEKELSTNVNFNFEFVTRNGPTKVIHVTLPERVLRNGIPYQYDTGITREIYPSVE